MSLTWLGGPTRSPGPRRETCALIAIKERAYCKTRLAGVLDQPARVELVRSMLASVLTATATARTLQQTIVVSPERDWVPAEIPVLADTGRSLNDALTQAHNMLSELGCRELLVLPADLPKITAAEIDALVTAGRASGFAIAPDASGEGTNALCLVSAQPFHFQFGPNSRRLHVQEAERMGLRPQIINLPGLALDVDSPADLELLGEPQWLTLRRA
jgi:2-phospho-L-lactate/phosphoenolpyruvate guanylyltransferase